MNVSDEDRLTLVKAFLAQAKSTQFWVDQYNQFKDGSSAKNAMFALGRIDGQVQLLLNVYGGQFVNLPKEVQDLSAHFSIAHDEISKVVVKVQPDIKEIR